MRKLSKYCNCIYTKVKTVTLFYCCSFWMLTLLTSFAILLSYPFTPFTPLTILFSSYPIPFLMFIPSFHPNFLPLPNFSPPILCVHPSHLLLELSAYMIPAFFLFSSHILPAVIQPLPRSPSSFLTSSSNLLLSPSLTHCPTPLSLLMQTYWGSGGLGITPHTDGYFIKMRLLCFSVK